MKIVAVVAARMTSSRLPGKVLLPIVGVPVLAHCVKRIQQSRYIHEVVIATTMNESDNDIVSLARELKVSFYRGSEEDVLARTLEAAQSVKADVIVQITSDCPLIDKDTIDQVITHFLEHPYLHYVHNQQIRTYPLGFSVEVFRTKDLEKIASITNDPAHREHVSLYFYEHPELYHLSNVEAPYFLRHPSYRLTLDTSEDYRVIHTIFESLYPQNEYFTLYDIIRYLQCNPLLVSYNSHIEQKRAR